MGYRYGPVVVGVDGSADSLGALLLAGHREDRQWDDVAERCLAGGNCTMVSDLYRQWLTHKFGTWHDQFGESGCVGCGRCIAWCPVGIDVTAELHARNTHPPTTTGDPR